LAAEAPILKQAIAECARLQCRSSLRTVECSFCHRYCYDSTSVRNAPQDRSKLPQLLLSAAGIRLSQNSPIRVLVEDPKTVCQCQPLVQKPRLPRPNPRHAVHDSRPATAGILFQRSPADRPTGVQLAPATHLLERSRCSVER
jgi:hypothetical protein